MCMCDDGNSVFQAKRQYLYSKIWKFGRLCGQGVKISSRKCYMFVYEWCLVFDLKINVNIELIKNTEFCQNRSIY